MIAIPIEVGKDAKDPEALVECENEYEYCDLKRNFGISKRVEYRFELMGTQAWMRAFTTPAGLFVWLPQAIMYT